MREIKILKVGDRLENAAFLDPITHAVRAIVNTVVKPQGLRDVLHGVPFGHSFHPISVQVPIGAWTSAAVLDLLPGNTRAARTLVGVGILSSASSIASGYVDWSQGYRQTLRVGIVHSWANAAAVALYTVSYLQRRGGASGKLTGFLGYATVSASGYLGGHLAYRLSSGANHVADVPHQVQPGWHAIGALADLPDGVPTVRTVDTVPVLTVRQGADVHVLADLCSHLAAPLHEGELTTVRGESCITCPLHSSVFSLERKCSRPMSPSRQTSRSCR